MRLRCSCLCGLCLGFVSILFPGTEEQDAQAALCPNTFSLRYNLPAVAWTHVSPCNVHISPSLLLPPPSRSLHLQVSERLVYLEVYPAALQLPD